MKVMKVITFFSTLHTSGTRRVTAERYLLAAG
jgi:hypothetical protein